MSPIRLRFIAPLFVVVTLILAVLVGRPYAYPDGEDGSAQRPNGCSCHDSQSSPSVAVSINGPAGVAPGSTHSYTLDVMGSIPGSAGGFDLHSTAGTFLPGTGSKILQAELVHSDPTRRSWTFQWTAPITEGPVQWHAVAMTADGGGDDAGDLWNFYGGVVNTPFTIQVNSLISVEGHGLRGLELGPATPNPSRGPMMIAYRLPQGCAVDLSVVDARGAVVRSLVQESRPAGAHAASWDGCRSNGAPAGAGVYFMRLKARGETRTMRFVRVD